MEITDELVLERFPDVSVDHDNKHFYRGLLEHRLLLSRCAECGTWHHPPRPICPRCLSEHVEPTEVSGAGVVALMTFLHQGPTAPGVDYSTPHPIVSVELVEQAGLRFTSTIVDCPHDDVVIGLPVELTWIDRGSRPLPVFRPRRAGTSPR